MSVAYNRWNVEEGVYDAVVRAADQYTVPRDLMLPIAGLESGFRPGARGDLCTAVGLNCTNSDDEGHCSFGLFQFNRCGGAGTGHSIEDLLDAEYNAQLAASTIRQRFDATGDWYQAIQPWSTRPTAWEIFQASAGDAPDPSGLPTSLPGVGDNTGLPAVLPSIGAFLQSPQGALTVTVVAAAVMVLLLSIGDTGTE